MNGNKQMLQVRYTIILLCCVFCLPKSDLEKHLESKGVSLNFHQVTAEKTLVLSGRNVDSALVCMTVRKFPDLVFVQLVSAGIDDSVLPCLADLPDLRYLDISDSPVTVAGLVQLGSLQRLRTLVIRNCPNVDSDSLPQLAKLKNLESLELSAEEYEPAALKRLKENAYFDVRCGYSCELR